LRVTSRVDVTGEVNLSSVAVLTEALSQAVNSRPARLDVDLSGVTFMGCAGVEVLVTARRAVPALTVVQSPNPVRRLLTLAGFTACLAPVRAAANP
jgi:anti-anti-sigma factor